MNQEKTIFIIIMGNQSYEQHLKRIEDTYGKLEGFSEASPFEKCIIKLKQQNCNYSQIGTWLGSPSKRLIREVILKYIPESLNTDCNHQKLVSIQVSPSEKRIIGLCKKFNQWDYDLDETDWTHFEIKDSKLYFTDENNRYSSFLSDWDERTQLCMLYNIARILGIDIKTNEFH